MLTSVHENFTQGLVRLIYERLFFFFLRESSPARMVTGA